MKNVRNNIGKEFSEILWKSGCKQWVATLKENLINSKVSVIFQGSSPKFASDIKQIWANNFYFPEAIRELWFPDKFRANKRWLICSDLLNIKGEI